MLDATLGTKNAEQRQGRFAVWKTIMLGMYSDMKELLLVLKTYPFCLRMTGEAENLLALRETEFNFMEKKREVDLVVVSPRQLGVQHTIYYERVRSRGIECGLESCPSTLPLQLCRQCEGENKTSTRIVMTHKTFLDGKNKPRIFSVTAHEGKIILDAYGGHDTICFHPDTPLIWIKPRR